jgi:hypothetical protein
MEPAPHECNWVIAEIAAALRTNPPAALSAAAYEHLRTCSRCRAGLLLLVRGFDPQPDQLATSRACEPCLEDLAAFIDLELEDPALAAATYPYVWWHLWICDSCSQTYELTHALQSAQQAGVLQPLRLWLRSAPPAVPVTKRIALTRQMLMLALPPRLGARSVSRGGESGGYVLYDDFAEEPERRQLTIVAQEQADGLWQIVVSAVPPPDGLLVITAGALRFAAPFGPDGRAMIADVSADVLTGPDGPSLEVGIVPPGAPESYSGEQKD